MEKVSEKYALYEMEDKDLTIEEFKALFKVDEE